MTLPIVSTEWWVATEPEIKYLPSGIAVCEFRVKAAANYFDKDEQKWKDGKTLWANAHAYSTENKQLAEHVHESIQKGDNIAMSGRIYVRTYETKDKVQKLSVDIDVDSIGPSLTFRTTPHGAAKQGSGASNQSAGTNTQQADSNASQGQQGGGSEDSAYPF